MRKHALLVIDVFWLAISPIAAIFLRDNLEWNGERLDQLAVYVALTVPIGTAVFLAAGVHRGVWRYATVLDVVRVAGAGTATILISLFVAFHFNRLEGVPRSIPFIQWFVLISALGATRAGARLVYDRRRRKSRTIDAAAPQFPPEQHVIVVGMTHVTELYLRVVAEYAAGWISVAGILAGEPHLHGREAKFHAILDAPEALLRVLKNFETHGIDIDRVVVTVPPETLPEAAKEALNEAERLGVQIDFLIDALNLAPPPDAEGTGQDGGGTGAASHQPAPWIGAAAGGYEKLKRALDFVVAAVVGIGLAPVIGAVALVVAFDVGRPVVFWQQRPGRFGKRFKLYKFRTMLASHDAAGRRIPDAQRMSSVGAFLRRTRLDELPQLYNILAGQMSFVGPRPLLAAEQRGNERGRLAVRPGLTGWAQINGGREVSVEEKTALDMWYVRRVSAKLDALIMLKTVHILINGDRRNPAEVRAALNELESTETEEAASDSDGAERPPGPPPDQADREVVKA